MLVGYKFLFSSLYFFLLMFSSLLTLIFDTMQATLDESLYELAGELVWFRHEHIASFN